MKLKEILLAIDAVHVHLEDEAILNKEFLHVFASDLMSDALALVQEHQEETLFLTGLNHEQALRTAEMLDFSAVILVRGKIPTEDTIALARSSGISLFYTKHSMFRTCGKIYEKGVGR